MNNNEKKIILVLFIIAVLLAGYTWGYPIVKNMMIQKNIEDTHQDVKDAENPSVLNQTADEPDMDFSKKNDIIEILDSSKEVYLESISGADYLVYLDKEERSIMEELLTDLTIDNVSQLIIDEQYYNFALHLQNQNTKIFFGEEVIFIQEETGSSSHWVDPEELINITAELEKIYLKHVNEFIQEIKPTSLTLETMTEGIRLNFSDKAIIESLQKSAVLKKIIDGRTIPADQYLYKMTISSDARNAVLVIIDDSVLRLSIIGEDAYFEYESGLISAIRSYIK
ncbi:MAG: hypothetical protein GX905_05720 [Bacteroidales bacterium]|nr:hypothetical protein [Bacteroidales bacterium]